MSAHYEEMEVEKRVYILGSSFFIREFFRSFYGNNKVST